MMKHLLTLSFLLLLMASLFAQPINDDCSGIINLGKAPVCPDNVLYNNLGATESNIGMDNFPNCFVGNPARDVWFSFVAVDTILDYRITLTAMADTANGIPAIVQPQLAIYRGDICAFDELVLLDCVSAPLNGSTVQLNLTSLTPNLAYYIRINDWSLTPDPNWGAFKLCIEKKPPVITIDQGFSNQCSGTLADAGGENGDYGNNQNYTFTICPTIPPKCIAFTLNYMNIENIDDVLTFYDGPNTNSPVLMQFDGLLPANFTLPPTPNQGAVCYMVYAQSGCLTINFTSDATGTYEGFLGSWECSNEPCKTIDPVAIDVNATAAQMIQSVIAGQTLVTITNINCANQAVGTFLAGDNSDLGLKQGLILSTGNAAVAGGVNNATGTSGFNGTPGDPNLDYLSIINGNGLPSQDACIVELDVLAASDQITFEYIFGSEEYTEYVNDNFNDIFAFLVSGPGIAGDPNMNNQLNIATLPDGTFVQINSVNHSSHWQYWRNNEGGQSVIFDGLTADSLGVKKSLTARLPTIPCETYHLKLAIADRGDSAFDSGVFISKINGGTPVLEVNYFSGVNYLVEECSTIPDQVVVKLDSPVAVPTTYTVTVEGTAEPGVDYILNIPSTITFLPNQSEFVFPIVVLTDGITEGTETIVLTISNDFGCGATAVSTVTIEVHDQADVEIFDGLQDSALICQTLGGCLQMKASGATAYSWSPANIFSNPNAANPTACPTSSGWVYVTGTLGICSDTDSIYLQFIDPVVEIVQGDLLNACEGDTIVLEAQNNVNNAGLLWSSFFLPFPDPTQPVQTVVIPNPGFFFITVSVNANGCTANDFITINADEFKFPQLINDTTICQNYSVDLGQDIPNTTTQYAWTPAQNLVPGPNVSGPIATPAVSTTYKLVATSASGACSDSAFVAVTVLPANVTILGKDTLYRCVDGDSLTLNATTSTGGTGLTWKSADTTFQTVTPTQIKVFPLESTWYYTELVVGQCIVYDSVFVQVDSLPDLPISAIPPKPSYCEGEEVTLISPTYEPADFPGIELMWLDPLPGALTPDSFLNLVFIAVETQYYIRTVKVNACFRRDSIPIEVVPVASIMIQPQDSAVCPGQQIKFIVTADPSITEFTWMPPIGLSCTNCKEPTVTVFGTLTYSVEGEFKGCPVGGSVKVIAKPSPGYQFPSPPFSCAGDPVLLNIINDNLATYTWTASDGSNVPDIAQPIVAPTQTTTYFLTATRDGCTITDEVTIVVPQDFTLSVDPGKTVCAGSQVTLNAMVNQSNILFDWTASNGSPVDDIANPTVTITGPVSYTLNTSDPAGCYFHTATIVFDVFPDFSLTVSNDVTQPQGQQTILVASVDLPGVTFVWTDNKGNTVGTTASITVAPCDTTIYTVTATHPNGCGTKSASVTINTLDVFVLSASGDLSIIQGESTTLTATSSLTGTTFTWKDNFGNTVGTNASITVSPCETTIYTVTANHPNGCGSKSQSLTVVVADAFAIASVNLVILGKDTTGTLYEGQEFLLTVTTVPPVLTGVTYTWTVNGQVVATTSDTTSGKLRAPEITDPALSEVPFTYGVLITSAQGCQNPSADEEGVVKNNPVEVPNAFSPNNDNHNDRFNLVSRVPVTILDFKVWNRWGQLVYDNEAGNQGWDGMFKKEPAPSDVYVYYIVWQIEGGQGVRNVMKGDVTLLR